MSFTIANQLIIIFIFLQPFSRFGYHFIIVDDFQLINRLWGGTENGVSWQRYFWRNN